MTGYPEIAISTTIILAGFEPHPPTQRESLVLVKNAKTQLGPEFHGEAEKILYRVLALRPKLSLEPSYHRRER